MPIPPRILTNELGCKCLVVGRTAALPPFVNGVGDKQRPKASRHYVINVEFLSQRTSRGKTLVASIVMAIIGSSAGTLTVQTVDGATLSRLIPFLLLGITIYFLMSPKVKQTDSAPILGLNAFACTAALGMGFYGGFFGQGRGSSMPFLFLWLLGHNLVKATAETKLMILAVNGTSAVIFAANGLVLWELALPMALPQIMGARLGSNLVMTRGSGLVQPIIMVVTIGVALKLLFSHDALL
jgi:uncharacterized membrane protein YfcA